MKTLILCSALLASCCLLACSETTKSDAPTKTAEPPAVFEEYIEASRQGDWQRVCSLLASREQKRISEFFRSSCPQGLQKRSKILQERARDTKLGSWEKDGSTWLLRLQPAGEIWISKNRLYFSEP